MQADEMKTPREWLDEMEVGDPAMMIPAVDAVRYRNAATNLKMAEGKAFKTKMVVGGIDIWRKK